MREITEQDHQERARCWTEFCAAAEAGRAGDFSLAKALCAKAPIVRGELWHFIKALNEGRIEKIGHEKYRPVKVRATA